MWRSSVGLFSSEVVRSFCVDFGMTYFKEDQGGMPVKDKPKGAVIVESLLVWNTELFWELVKQVLLNGFVRTIHELDAEDEENFNVSEDSENCDATETPMDTGMEAEAEELEGESPDERHVSKMAVLKM
ncbi:hypothetical protein AHAS_Ahas17G0307600 [Arachis hypogaea]